MRTRVLNEVDAIGESARLREALLDIINDIVAEDEPNPDSVRTANNYADTHQELVDLIITTTSKEA